MRPFTGYDCRTLHTTRNPHRRTTVGKRNSIIAFLLIAAASSIVWGAVDGTDSVETVRTGLGANDLSDIVWDGNAIWVSGSGTLTSKLWGDGRLSSDWLSYTGEPGFGNGSMTALHARNDTLIVAWRYTQIQNDSPIMVGDGFSISTDRGSSWRRITILDIFPGRSELNYPGNYTVSYDVEFDDGTIWLPTTMGFLLKSTDFGYTWENIFPNGDILQTQNPNHHAQCLDAYGDTLWVGSFQGMNVSTDGGVTWENFSHPVDGSDPGPDPLPGNFCVAVEHTVVDGATHVWVGSQPYFGVGTYGIYHTDDNGASWTHKTSQFSAWNFAFGQSDPAYPHVSGSSVFAASDAGLVASHDLGETWAVIPIMESPSLAWSADIQVFGVLVVDGQLWVTSSDGLALSEDWGATWSIYRGVTRVESIDNGDKNIGISSSFDDVETYAFPNPITPRRSNPDYARTRINYALTSDARVSVNVYDYGGRMIRELVLNEHRSGGRDHQEAWDGRDGDGEIVPNGVYFFDISTNRGDRARGKIMVLD